MAARESGRQKKSGRKDFVVERFLSTEDIEKRDRETISKPVHENGNDASSWLWSDCMITILHEILLNFFWL